MKRQTAQPLSRKNRRQAGQSLVEMALMMTVTLIILAGAIDLGRVYFVYLALQDAAAEGATYGIIYPSWATSADNADPDNITYRAQNESPSGVIDWSNTTVTVEAPDPTPGNLVSVTVAYDYTLLTPVVSSIVGSPTLTLEAKAVQTILRAGP